MMRTFVFLKVAYEEDRLPERVPGWCHEGGKGGGKPPRGRFRRFARKEEKNKGRMKEKNKEGKEDSKKGEVLYTLVLVGRQI